MKGLKDPRKLCEGPGTAGVIGFPNMLNAPTGKGHNSIRGGTLHK
jgi:hypothetical protein